MSLNPFKVPLLIEIKPTVQKGLLIFTPHFLALSMIASFDVFSLAVKGILLIFISISAGYYFRLYVMQKSKKSVISIQQDSANNWFITTHDKGHEAPPKSVILLASSFVNKYLILMNYRDNNKSYYSTIITPDSISSNDFRRLQVRLKLTNIKKS